MDSIFRGVITTLVSAPIVYLLFSNQDNGTRITMAIILSVGLGVFAAQFLGSSKADK